METFPQPPGEVPGRSLRVRVDDEEHLVDAEVVPGGVSLIVDGRVVDLVMHQLSPGDVRRQVSICFSGKEVAASLSDGHQKGNSVRPLRQDAEELRAPMPGRVVRVLKGPGDEVEEGMPVLVMAAMKMENELRAAGPGRIRCVHVAEEDSVERGALLVTFEVH